jgi:CHAD domain-containing protein
LAGSGLQASILDLKHAQEILGDLHDLQVLSEALADALGGDLVERLPELHRLIGTQEAERWQEWQALSGTLRADGHRQTVWRVLLRPAADMKKPAGEAGEDQTNR